MKRSLFFILASALALSTPAQTPTENDPVTIVGSKTVVAPYRMFVDDFREYKGRYSLSNGLELGLTNVGRKMYAQVGDQPRHEILATGQDRFVARDGKLDLHLVLTDNGRDASGELSYIDERAGANGALATLPRTEQWVRVAFR